MVSGMSAPQKATKFRWTTEKRRAAQMLAEGKLTQEEIAKMVGVDRGTLFDWRKHPEFSAYLEALKKQYAALSERYAIGRVARRVERLDASWRAMQKIIKERGKAPEMHDVPGGQTGLLVHVVKTIGRGEHARRVDLYRVDTALLKEMRETAREAAEQLGQRRDDK
jgi:transposase-like protein